MSSNKNNPARELLKVLNLFPEMKKTYKTIYGASEKLKKIYQNSVIFDYISILSYNKGQEHLDKLNTIFLPDFGKAINDFKNNTFNFFINCFKEKKFEDDQYVIEKILQLINDIPSNSLILKYIKMINPLLENKEQKYKVKIILLAMIPNDFDNLYSEMSKEFPLFPNSVLDFYSYSKIKSNTDTIKEFVEKRKKDSKDIKNEIKEISSETKEINE